MKGRGREERIDRVVKVSQSDDKNETGKDDES